MTLTPAQSDDPSDRLVFDRASTGVVSRDFAALAPIANPRLHDCQMSAIVQK